MFFLFVLICTVCGFDVRDHRCWREGVNGGIYFCLREPPVIGLRWAMTSLRTLTKALRCRLMRGAQIERPGTTFEKSVSNESVLWGADSQGCLFPVHKPVLLARATLAPHSRERLVAVQIEFFSQ